MIKVKIYEQSWGYRKFENSSQPVTDYCYCVYFLGWLIHSVTLRDIHRDAVKQVFGNREIIPKPSK
jgi:hypothetical protein